MRRISGGMINSQLISGLILVIPLWRIIYMFLQCEDVLVPAKHEVSQKFMMCGLKAEQEGFFS